MHGAPWVPLEKEPEDPSFESRIIVHLASKRNDKVGGGSKERPSYICFQEETNHTLIIESKEGSLGSFSRGARGAPRISISRKDHSPSSS